MFAMLRLLYIRKWMEDAVLIFRNRACLEESDFVCGCLETVFDAFHLELPICLCLLLRRAAMDLATGAMGSLLPKLVQLLGKEYKLQKGIKGDIKFLEGELRSMRAALSKVGDVPRGQLDEQVEIWADEVRDLSYDMEDVVDRFLVRVEGCEPDTDTHMFKRLLKQMGDLLTKGKTRHKIAGEIKDIKVRVKEVAERRDRYKVDSIVSDPAATTSVDPRLLALYKEKQEIVGADEARDELIKRLTDGDDSLYDRLQAQYACKAFVVVGRNPDVKKVLKDILLGIDKQKYMDFNLAKLDERQLIDELIEQLVNKRYFIVIDDIWDTITWGIIRCAFMDNNCGSRIITTTRIFEVAIKASEVYRIKPLSPEKSEELFYTRLSGDKSKCNYDQQIELSEEILRKCDGVPLAIIAIASLLASKPMDDWSKVYTSIGFGSGHNEDVENMRKILLYSYYDMPSYLRTCLLHLSIHPEDAYIRKVDTIWKWVAEGFVHEEPDMGSFEVGERYFDELINRSMIRPYQFIPHGPVTGCYVHDMVLDMICSLSKEENFVSILGSDEQHSSLQGNVRRLAIQNGVIIDKDGTLAHTRTQQLRSFNATSCVIGAMPPLESFQALRVLDLYRCTYHDGHSCNLEHLGKLLQLRYLGLFDTPIIELPEEIGDLKFLQTLDIRHTSIKELPLGVSLLRQLRCLRMYPCSVRVPDWMGKLTSLENLEVDNFSESPNFVKELGKLTELRRLIIGIVELGAESWKCKAFVESLDKLQKIQLLDITSTEEANLEIHVPSRQLRDLLLCTNSPRLPAWIITLLVPNLTFLWVTLKAVKEQDIEILGRLPELLTMELLVMDSDNSSPPCECSGGAFPKLKHSHTPAPLLALKGAMPSVESVSFRVDVRPLKDSNFDFDFSSLGNLPLLEKATVDVVCTGATVREVEEAEAAVRRAVQAHANHPFLLLKREGET
uniref:Uncharacterized protein n=1 Tax=Avena sativa TaxID=4498 RepID=A0ACD5XDE3_AVESA